MRRFQLKSHAAFRARAGKGRKLVGGGIDLGAVGVVQRNAQFAALLEHAGVGRDVGAHVERCVLKRLVKAAVGKNIGYALARLLVNANVAEYARHPPHILVLKKAAVAVAHDLERQHIGAGEHAAADVKFGAAETVLGVADKFSVEIYVGARADAVKTQHCAAALAGGGIVKIQPVAADGI